MRRAACAAGRFKRSIWGVVMSVLELAQLAAREEPNQHPLSGGDAVSQLQEPSAALLELEEGALHTRDEPAHEQPQTRFMADDRRSPLSVAAVAVEPPRPILGAPTGGQLGNDDGVGRIQSFAEDLRRFPGAGERACGEDIDSGDERSEAFRALLHLLAALVGQWAGRVVTMRT